MLSVVAHSQFDHNEFLSRWSQARVQSLRKISGVSDPNLEEWMLLKNLNPAQRDLALKSVFDFSRRLGQSAVRYFSLVWEISDLKEVLEKSTHPCLQGAWNISPSGAHVLKRQGCSPAKEVGSFYCDYWREAIDGLVMGVGEEERFARHESVEHGDSSCVDVFFTEGSSSQRLDKRFGEIPEKMREPLQKIQSRFSKMNLSVEFQGYAEGTLFYQFESQGCGGSSTLTQQLFVRDVAKVFPELKLKNCSARAVIGE